MQTDEQNTFKQNTNELNKNLNRAILWALNYFFIASVSIVVVRYLSSSMHPIVIFFYRSLFSLPFVLLYFMRMGKGFLKSNRHPLHLCRAFVNFLAISLWFYAVTIMPLAEAVTLSFTAPLFATLIAVITLKEKVSKNKWLALLTGFIGVVIVLRPGFEVLHLGAALVLIVSLLIATSSILLKKLNEHDDAALSVFYFVLCSVPVSLPVALPYLELPKGEQWLWLVFISLCNLFAQFSISKAVQKAEISKLAPYDFSRLIFTAIIAYIVFAELPDLYIISGGIIIAASSAYSNYSDRCKSIKQLSV